MRMTANGWFSRSADSAAWMACAPSEATAVSKPHFLRSVHAMVWLSSASSATRTRMGTAQPSHEGGLGSTSRRGYARSLATRGNANVEPRVRLRILRPLVRKDLLEGRRDHAAVHAAGLLA